MKKTFKVTGAAAGTVLLYWVKFHQHFGEVAKSNSVVAKSREIRRCC